MKMPSKRQYDLVLDDGPDSKIPLHNEDAFQHGIDFHAKYIGTLDVPRPTSRVEIVAAMRRIRYDFKAKAVKKKKVTITVSVDGVKVVLQKKNRRVGKQQWSWDESRLIVLQHPIYRIFYVSHDSQDLKIFSYIARDSSTNVFRCNVFKAYKKSQAMNIVRTIGQAFEVCHRISLQTAAQNEEGHDGGSEKSSEEGNDQAALQSSSMLEKPPLESSPSNNGTSTSTQSPEDAVKQTQQLIDSLCLKPVKPPAAAAVLASSPVVTPLSDTVKDEGSLGSYHRIQFLRQQLELQTQQTQFIVAQVQLLKDQLAAETAARIEAQTRTHQLLIQNRELLAHISTLVNRLVQSECSTDDMLSSDQQRSPKEVLSVFDGSLSDASFLFMSASSGLSKPSDRSLLHNTDCKPELKGSPDSGHKEMSSGSLALGSVDLIDGWISTADKTKTSDSSDRKNFEAVLGRGTANTVRPVTISGTSTNGMTINNLFLENKTLRESGATHRNELTKVITPIPAQDASGNRLELNIAPKLDPPPKINRNSSRVCDPLTLGGSDKLASVSSAAAAATTGPGKDFKPGSAAGKRYSWESYTPSDRQNGFSKKDHITQHKFLCDEVKKSPKKLLGSVAYANGNDKSGNCAETFHTPASTVHGLKGIKNRFAVQHQNSVDSTAKLKLSFSDNE